MNELTTLDKKKTIVSYLLRNKILVTPEILTKLNEPAYLERLHGMSAQEAPVTHTDVVDVKQAPAVIIEKDPMVPGRKVSIDDFVQYFRQRYRQMQRILSERQDLQGAIGINRLKDRKDREKVTVIAYIYDKQETKNGNIILTIEDTSGTTKAIITKGREELFKQARDLQLDTVVGLAGQCAENAIFVSEIIIPDIPVTHEMKKSQTEEYIVILSDCHVGSNNFLGDELWRCVRWLRGELGSPKHRAIAAKVTHVFVVGDMVDGIGIYPAQEKELAITDIHEQYKLFTDYVKKIPASMRIIICPGNHDALRLAEPQPRLPEDLAPELYTLPNVTMVGSPSLINICRGPAFSGFDVLLYHGYSYDDYGDRVESIRESGRNVSDRVGPVMKYLLQQRHLSPTYDTKTPFMITPDKDAMVIDRVPDFFFSGHIHKAASINYRGVTIIAGSCWQSRTAFQEKFGHNPDPCKVPIVNLQTREVTILNFGEENE